MKSREEAAEYLGISTRTLARYTKARRIPSHQQKGKTRPHVVYAEEDLDAFKAELEEQHAPSAQPAASTTAMQRVGFRLDPFYIQLLQEEGTRQSMSAGEYARYLVVRSLENREQEPILTAMAGLLEEIGGLKDTIAHASSAQNVSGSSSPSSSGEVKALHEEVIDYRKEFAMVVYTLLTRVIGIADEGALEWIRSNLSHADKVAPVDVSPS